MSYTPLPWTDFQGLDLRSEPDGSGCVDLKNVLLDKPGAVRSRYGSSLFATPTSSTAVLRMRPFYRSAGDQLLAHFTTASAGKVTAFSSVGAAVATQTMNSSSSVCDFASIGTPGAQRAYVCDSGGLMYRWDGAAFTQIAGSPKCSYVAATADGRLCAANISTVPTGSGATASSSLVHFSDPGAPETWGANNYVYLAPGDGDAITAVVAWQNLTFVFKRFKFFVFDSTSTDGSGNPVFNYRTIDTRVAPQTAFSAVPTPDGVYFTGTDGVYLTTGFAPRKVSTPVDPFFTGDTNVYWTGSTVGNDLWGDGTDATNVWGDGTNPALRWGDGASGDMRLAYAANELAVFRKGREDMLVLDTQTNQWTYRTFPSANHSMTAFQYGGAGAEVFLLGQTASILRMDKTATTDNGSAITARYRSGFFNLATVRQRTGIVTVPSQEVTVRESIVDGVGTVSLSVARDWDVDLPTTGGGAKAAVKLGTPPDVAQGRHRHAQRGRAVSFQLETARVSDDFSTDSIANYTADQGATTNVAITGGVMQAAANLTTTNDLVLTGGTLTDFGDTLSAVKTTVGTSRTGFASGVILKRVSANNFLTFYLYDDGATSFLKIDKVISGSGTALSATTLSRISASTSYWVRGAIVGNEIAAEFFTADPATGTLAANRATYSLTTTEAATFGAGVTGKSGVLFLPQQAAASVDDFSVSAGGWRVDDLTFHLTGFRQSGIKTTT